MPLIQPHRLHVAATVGEGLDLAQDLLFGALLNGHDEADHCLKPASSDRSAPPLIQITSCRDLSHTDQAMLRKAACKPEVCPFSPAGLNA